MVAPVVEMVTVSLVPEAVGMTGLAGLKEQFAPVGKPEHARLTGLLNPLRVRRLRV